MPDTLILFLSARPYRGAPIAAVSVAGRPPVAVLVTAPLAGPPQSSTFVGDWGAMAPVFRVEHAFAPDDGANALQRSLRIESYSYNGVATPVDVTLGRGDSWGLSVDLDGPGRLRAAVDSLAAALGGTSAPTAGGTGGDRGPQGLPGPAGPAGPAAPARTVRDIAGAGTYAITSTVGFVLVRAGAVGLVALALPDDFAGPLTVENRKTDATNADRLVRVNPPAGVTIELDPYLELDTGQTTLVRLGADILATDIPFAG